MTERARLLCTRPIWQFIGGTDVLNGKSAVLTSIREMYTRVTGRAWDRRKHGEDGYHLWNFALRGVEVDDDTTGDNAQTSTSSGEKGTTSARKRANRAPGAQASKRAKSGHVDAQLRDAESDSGGSSDQ